MSVPKVKHINFALVESPRPAMYSALKYWGKKPHNIWHQYISAYCPPNGVVLDPFCGSGVAAFEAVISGRKAIAFDLNPLSEFVIEVTTSQINEVQFKKAIDQICDTIRSDTFYLDNFTISQSDEIYEIVNFHWEDRKIKKFAIEKGKSRRVVTSSKIIQDISDASESIKIPHWHPIDKFPSTEGFTQNFINGLGGNSFNYIWTRRNLYVLSKIFDLIVSYTDDNLKKQLLFTFLQSLHLTSKMVVPRNEESDRDFSGSWGRPDYMIRRRSLEQNPVIIFERAAYGKQGTLKALKNSDSEISKPLRITRATKKIDKKADINYGTFDISDITEVVQSKSVDFIITDPPYAGLIRYLELSMIWLVWLQKVDSKYQPDLKSEITVDRNRGGRAGYTRKLQDSFRKMYLVLKDDGYLVVTFHHKNIQEWNELINAIKIAGFKIDKVTHQYNRRSGEANVANPYGTSGSDFYIRCVKNREIDFTDDKSRLEGFVFNTIVKILSERGEETPYDFIVAGVMPELLQAGYISPTAYKDELRRILDDNTGEGKPFLRMINNGKAGDYWWFNNPDDYVSLSNIPLTDRVERSVLAILRRNISVKFDDVIGELFQQFPNGLTPDPRSIVAILEKYAYKSNNKWKIMELETSLMTKHTEVILNIVKIAQRMGVRSFVGKREQPESIGDGLTLRDTIDLKSLTFLNDKQTAADISRLEMIDCILIDSDDNVSLIFEIENSTNFMSAIQRASNLAGDAPKIMVIPNKREQELLNVKDKLFVVSFKSHNWRYMLYSEIESYSHLSTPSIDNLFAQARNLP